MVQPMTSRRRFFGIFYDIRVNVLKTGFQDISAIGIDDHFTVNRVSIMQHSSVFRRQWLFFTGVNIFRTFSGSNNFKPGKLDAASGAITAGDRIAIR